MNKDLNYFRAKEHSTFVIENSFVLECQFWPMDSVCMQIFLRKIERLSSESAGKDVL